MTGLYEFTSAVWAAARHRLRRRQHLPVGGGGHRPGSACAHVAPSIATVRALPLRLDPADANQGYCGFCGETPCSCLGGGAA